jgi:hypothetical protein
MISCGDFPVIEDLAAESGDNKVTVIFKMTVASDFTAPQIADVPPA